MTLSVTESAIPVTYSLSLCSKPQSAVTISLELSELALVQLDVEPSAHFFFDDDNWQIPQTVRVEATQNQFIEPPIYTVYINHTTTSDDSNFNHSKEDNPNIMVIVFNDELGAYIPTVRRGFTPTPTRTPKWEHLAPKPPQIADVIISNNQIYIGEDSNSNLAGIYRADVRECNMDVNFTSVKDGIRVKDYAFSIGYGLAAINGRGVYYSQDNGNTWNRTKSDINAYHFAIVIINNNLAYSGADDGIYRSTDRGISWNRIVPDNGVGPNLINTFVYSSFTNLLWIGTHGNGVWTLTPGTNHFNDRSAGLGVTEKDRQVWSILANVENQIYLGTSNGIYMGTGNIEWKQSGLKEQKVLALEKYDNRIYAGLEQNGVYRFNVQGIWEETVGLPTGLTVKKLFADSNGGICSPENENRPALLAGTGSGLWIYR